MRFWPFVENKFAKSIIVFCCKCITVKMVLNGKFAKSLNFLFSIRVRFSFCWDFSIIPCVLLCFAKVCTHTNVATVTCFVKTQFCQKVSSIGVGNKLTNKDKPIFFTCPCWWSFFHKTENIPRMAHYSQNVQGLLHSLYIKIAGLTYTCMAYTSCSTS